MCRFNCAVCFFSYSFDFAEQKKIIEISHSDSILVNIYRFFKKLCFFCVAMVRITKKKPALRRIFTRSIRHLIRDLRIGNRFFNAIVSVERNPEANRQAFLLRPARVINRRHSVAVEPPQRRRPRGPGRRKRAKSISSVPETPAKPSRQVIASAGLSSIIDALKRDHGNNMSVAYNSSFHTKRVRTVALPSVVRTDLTTRSTDPLPSTSRLADVVSQLVATAPSIATRSTSANGTNAAPNDSQARPTDPLSSTSRSDLAEVLPSITELESNLIELRSKLGLPPKVDSPGPEESITELESNLMELRSKLNLRQSINLSSSLKCKPSTSNVVLPLPTMELSNTAPSAPANVINAAPIDSVANSADSLPSTSRLTHVVSQVTVATAPSKTNGHELAVSTTRFPLRRANLIRSPRKNVPKRRYSIISSVSSIFKVKKRRLTEDAHEIPTMTQEMEFAPLIYDEPSSDDDEGNKEN